MPFGTIQKPALNLVVVKRERRFYSLGAETPGAATDDATKGGQEAGRTKEERPKEVKAGATDLSCGLLAAPQTHGTQPQRPGKVRGPSGPSVKVKSWRPPRK